MRRVLAVAITAVLTAAGCGVGTGRATDEGDTAAPIEAASPAETAGPTETTAPVEAAGPAETEAQTQTDAESSGGSETEQAPRLVVDKIGGGQIDFADLLGQDAVLWFWAPW